MHEFNNRPPPPHMGNLQSRCQINGSGPKQRGTSLYKLDIVYFVRRWNILHARATQNKRSLRQSRTIRNTTARFQHYMSIGRTYESANVETTGICVQKFHHRFPPPQAKGTGETRGNARTSYSGELDVRGVGWWLCVDVLGRGGGLGDWGSRRPGMRWKRRGRG